MSELDKGTWVCQYNGNWWHRWHYLLHKIQHSEALGPKFLAAMHCNPIINIYALRDQNTGQGEALYGITNSKRPHAFKSSFSDQLNILIFCIMLRKYVPHIGRLLTNRIVWTTKLAVVSDSLVHGFHVVIH